MKGLRKRVVYLCRVKRCVFLCKTLGVKGKGVAEKHLPLFILFVHQFSQLIYIHITFDILEM